MLNLYATAMLGMLNQCIFLCKRMMVEEGKRKKESMIQPKANGGTCDIIFRIDKFANILKHLAKFLI